jgi:hypothetical protein
MPEIRTDLGTVDIEVNEFLFGCNDKEIQTIIDDLILSGWISREQIITGKDEDWVEGCNKLLESKFKLTIEEEETIKKIMGRL